MQRVRALSSQVRLLKFLQAVRSGRQKQASANSNSGLQAQKTAAFRSPEQALIRHTLNQVQLPRHCSFFYIECKSEIVMLLKAGRSRPNAGPGSPVKSIQDSLSFPSVPFQ